MKQELKFCYCLILLCSIGLTAFTTSGDRSISSSYHPVRDTDSLRPLVPKGVFLTPEGFRLVLDERVRLNQCVEVVAIKDKALEELGRANLRLQGENMGLMASDAQHRENAKSFRRSLLATSISSGVGWGIALVLAVKLLFF